MRLTSLTREQFKGYARAAAIAGAAAALQWAAHPLVGSRVPFLFFMPAVMLAAAWYGRGPGLLVSLVGFVDGQLVLPPVGLRVDDPLDQASALLFLAVAVVVAVAAGRVREIAERAQVAERRLVLAVAETGIGVFDLDLMARTAYVSPSIARLVGLPVSDRPVPLEAWLARVPADVAAESRRQVAARLRERSEGYEREITLRHGDGTPLCLLVRVHVVWLRGRAVRLRGAVVDISARKAVDAQLARTRADLDQQLDDLRHLHALSSQLLESAPMDMHLQGILETLAGMHGAVGGTLSLRDTDRHTLEIVASLGFDRSLVERQSVTDSGQGACALVIAAGQRVVIEDTERDPRYASCVGFARSAGFRAIHATPLVSQRGDVLGVLSLHYDRPHVPDARERTLADICARKAAVFIEREHARTERDETQGRFRAVLEASAVPFLVISPVREGADDHIVDFRATYLNGAAARLFGATPDDLLGRRVTTLATDRGPGTADFAHWVDVAERHQVVEYETRGPFRDREGWLHVVASPLSGSVALWAADITAHKKAESMLREADRRKDEFLATLAHELRNPLAPIRQAATLARTPGCTEAQRRWSHEVIDRQVRHMALLLDDLLDVSRITRGVLSLHKRGTDLAEVVDGAVETAQPLIQARQQMLTVDVPTPSPRFEADALRLSQVIANLLTNAAKYTPAGGRITLTARQAGAEIVVQVADDGIGIAAESLPHIFDMFTQLKPAGEHGEGLGIGLSLARGLVDLHGGTLTAASDGPGLGSVFTVRLPTGVASVREGGTAPAAPDGALVRRRVLVADDNRDAADSLSMLLRLAGHDVVTVYDGDEAIDAWTRGRPEICLLDIGMPGRDGNDVAQAIRRLPGGERPLLVAITGWGQSADRHRALSAGFDAHVTKPVDPDQLMRLFESGAPRTQPEAV
jgi:PAS domain S-box-containing protein